MTGFTSYHVVNATLGEVRSGTQTIAQVEFARMQNRP